MAEIWGLAIAGGASLIGSVISSNAATSAANTQANAESSALGLQSNEFNTITGLESPYVQSGDQAQSQLNYLLGNGTPGVGQTATGSSGGSYGSLLSPFTSSMMQQYSPAYQFQLQQGVNGALSSSASGQGALSGAAQQGLTSYNQEMANTAFNTAFQQYNTQQSNIYQRLSGLSQLGQTAASNTGSLGSNMVNSEGQTISNIGTAEAGGEVGSANALSSGVSSLGNLGMIYALMGSQGQGANAPGWVNTDSGSSVPSGIYGNEND